MAANLTTASRLRDGVAVWRVAGQAWGQDTTDAVAPVAAPDEGRLP